MKEEKLTAKDLIARYGISQGSINRNSQKLNIPKVCVNGKYKRLFTLEEAEKIVSIWKEHKVKDFTTNFKWRQKKPRTFFKVSVWEGGTYYVRKCSLSRAEAKKLCKEYAEKRILAKASPHLRTTRSCSW